VTQSPVRDVHVHYIHRGDNPFRHMLWYNLGPSVWEIDNERVDHDIQFLVFFKGLYELGSFNGIFISRFCDGLKSLGVLDEMRQNKKRMEDLFIDNQQELDSNTVEILFEPVFGPEESNTRRLETKAHGMWRDFLLDLEGNNKRLFYSELINVNFVTWCTTLEKLSTPLLYQTSFQSVPTHQVQ
jgi:hypothetical protein